jgi:hypothetical protein
MVVTSQGSERKYRICALGKSAKACGYIGRHFFKQVVKDHPEEQSNALDFVGGIVRKISSKELGSNLIGAMSARGWMRVFYCRFSELLKSAP